MTGYVSFEGFLRLWVVGKGNADFFILIALFAGDIFRCRCLFAWLREDRWYVKSFCLVILSLSIVSGNGFGWWVGCLVRFDAVEGVFESLFTFSWVQGGGMEMWKILFVLLWPRECSWLGRKQGGGEETAAELVILVLGWWWWLLGDIGRYWGYR